MLIPALSCAGESWAPVTLENYYDDWGVYVEGTKTPFKCEGDYDGDGKVDHARLVLINDYTIRVAVRLSGKNNEFLLGEDIFSQLLGEDKKGVFALRTTPEGSYEAIGEHVELSSDALSIVKFGSSEQVVYWVNGVLKSLWFGD